MAALAVLGVLGAACGPGPSGTVVEAGPDLAAIRQARDVYGPAAEEVGLLVRVVAEVARVARLEPAPSAADGTPSRDRDAAVEALRDAADDLDASLDRHAPEALDAETASIATEPAVAASAAAWDQVVASAHDVVVGARGAADHLDALLGTERALALVAEGWDEPGSRSQQSTHFRELLAEAEAQVVIAQAIDEVPACARAAAARIAAAQLVRDRTAELKGHVDRREGASFDETRASYDEAPWHAELPLRDAQDAACWESSSAVTRGAAEVASGLDDLVRALNTGTSLPESPSETG